MRIQVSTTTIAALSSTPLLSISDYVHLVHATESPKSHRAINAANVHEHELYIKKKLRAKIAHKKKSRSRGGAGKSSEEYEFCTPVELELSSDYLSDWGTIDLGILAAKCVNSTHHCLLDAQSSLGGRCQSMYFDELNEKFEECMVPQDSNRIDVGILGVCNHPGHQCVQDSSSPLGGVCIDGSMFDEFTEEVDSNPTLRGRRHLMAMGCNYLNGTSGGVKCGGLNACDGVPLLQISQHIGCGSCNGDHGNVIFV